MFYISAEQKNDLARIGKKYSLKLILLHGSYATQTEHVGSDLDIAVLAQKSFKSKEFLDLHSDIAAILGDSADRELDLKLLNKTDPLFLYHVANHSVLLHGNQSDYTDFKAHAFAIYMDSKDIRRLERLLIDKYQTHLNQTYAW